MTDSCRIEFPDTNFSAIVLEKQSPLAEHLTVQNSPILFGCRTGICGTCLVVVTGKIPPPRLEEQELLDTLAPGNSTVRLACQIDLISDLQIRKAECHS